MVKWTDQLGEEDLSFVKRFILASGSLKQVAKEYGISYPTVRLRLDRLIEKIRVVDNQEITSEFEKQLRFHFAEGRIGSETFRTLLSTHRKELEEHHEDQNHNHHRAAGHGA